MRKITLYMMSGLIFIVLLFLVTLQETKSLAHNPDDLIHRGVVQEPENQGFPVVVAGLGTLQAHLMLRKFIPTVKVP